MIGSQLNDWLKIATITRHDLKRNLKKRLLAVLPTAVLRILFQYQKSRYSVSAREVNSDAGETGERIVWSWTPIDLLLLSSS